MNSEHLLYNVVYVLKMYRWGNQDGHQYIQGVYTSYEDAVKEGDRAREYRANKYEYTIHKMVLNGNRDDADKIGMLEDHPSKGMESRAERIKRQYTEHSELYKYAKEQEDK